MTPSTVIVLLAFSLIASDIIPSEARYKAYQRRKASRYLNKQQRRQIDDVDLGGLPDSVGINSLAQRLSEMLSAAVSQALVTVINEQPLSFCPGAMRRRNSNSNFNYNSNINSIIDPIGQKSADFDTVDEDEGDIDLVEDDGTADDQGDEDLLSKRNSKRRQLKARRNRNRNVNVNQNYNLSARKEETNTNPSAEGSIEDETTTETPKIASRHRRRNNFK